jgi:hypothetical protein
MYKMYAKYPGRFLVECGFDFTGCNQPGFGPAAIKELERCHKVGAVGLGECTDKGMGLDQSVGTGQPERRLSSPAGKVMGLHPDDPKMDPLWDKCRQLGMPIVGLHISDPVWGFYLLWLAPYLSQVRHLSLMQIGLLAWVPFLTADFGSVVGGAYSSWWIKRGLAPTAARKIGMCTAAALMPVALLAARVHSPLVAVLLFSTVTFGHQAWSANTLTLPADLFPKRMVARTFGLAAGMSNVATALFAYYTGWMVDRHGFAPVFLTVAFMHPVAAIIASIMIRSSKQSDSAGTA